MKSSMAWSLVVLCLCCNWALVAAAQDDGADYFDDSGVWSGPESGFRFQADALIWTRNNSGDSGPVIGGPESFGLGNSDYTYEAGYRLGLGWMIDPNYEVEGVWTRFAGWNTGGGGILTRAISFDGGESSLVVDPSGNANFINRSTFFRPLFDAATDPRGATVNDETTEFEFFQPGSTYRLVQTSELDDGQVNFKTRRTQGRRLSFGLGYRHIRLDEGAQAGVIGTFDAFDVDGDEGPGGNNPNDQLSDEALTAHGLTFVSGGGGFLDPASGGEAMSLLWNGSANNQLNGVQGVVDGTIVGRGPFALEGNLRAGLFHNRVDGTITELYSQQNGSVYRRSFHDDNDGVAFAANVGLGAVIQLAERVRFRTGYEVMLITNVALAPAQQQGIVYDALGRASYSVQSDDSVILHGARAGLEVEW